MQKLLISQCSASVLLSFAARLLAWLCLLLLTGVGNAAASPRAEIRGVWLTNVGSGVLYVPWGIDRAFRQLNRLHFNTVYPVVWNRGYTEYPSAVAQRATGRSQEPLLTTTHLGQDVLAAIVQTGKRQNLRIIPWFEYGFMAPAKSDLVRRHPDWLTTRRNGSKTLEVTEPEATDVAALDAGRSAAPSAMPQLPQVIRARGVGTRVWLNPLHPQVQQFLLDLITEVVTKYPVDGIQLDDHFGLPVEFGYDTYTIALYQQEHQGAKPPADFLNADWMRWRAQKLTDFMGQIFRAVKAINPDCLISLSPNSQRFSYQSYLQDWHPWVEQGWVEELVLQAYRNDLTRFQAELDQPAIRAAQQRIPVAIGILTGTWRQPIAFKQIQAQVQAARSRRFSGVSFFYWETLWSYLTPEAPHDRRTNFQQLFSDR